MFEQFVAADASRSTNVLDFVTLFRERLHHAYSVAKTFLSFKQTRMKRHYDKKAVERTLQPGDEVLVLTPTPSPALMARFSGPYVVRRKVSDTDYVIDTPD